MSNRKKKPFEAIRAVLLHEWDPIGVGEWPMAVDEYDDYVWHVWALLAQHQPREQLVDYLWWVETVHMCLSGSRPHTESIAERLARLWGEIEAQP